MTLLVENSQLIGSLITVHGLLASFAVLGCSIPMMLAGTARRATRAVVSVIDDDVAIRDSLKWLLESAGYTVNVYSGAEEFLAAFEPAQPGCLVLDVRMPGIGGMQLQETLSKRGIEIPLIMITGHGELPTAVLAMKNGAVDFLEKPFGDKAIMTCIEEALRRDAQLRETAAQRAEIKLRMQRLTPRERQVLDLVVLGKSNKQIATEFGISDKTVEFHRARVMHKLVAANVAELVRMALLVQPRS